MSCLSSCSTAQGRRDALRQAKRELEAEREPSDADEQLTRDPGSGDQLQAERIVANGQGRRGWLRGARDQLEAKRAAATRPVPRGRRERLLEGKRLLEQEHRVVIDANAAYEAYRARGVMKDGRRFGRAPDPFVPPEVPDGVVNITDPDSRNVKCPRGYVQGYNAQAVVTEQQIVIAAEVNTDSSDFGHLEPMVTAARRQLRQVGIFNSARRGRR